ncbi:MAG: type II toxin-antitoxin system VapC family toxin [Trueperaceae bacterium]|nr:type II toxin-antitoxin system VapC family toxin [Trueperaceae bacterium]
MRFWDSSAIVPLLARQSSTSAVEALLGDDPQVVVWWATSVECVSALARLEREGTATTQATSRAAERLRRLVRTFDEVQPTERVRTTAERLLRTHPLRAADSLQLAAAIEAASGRPSELPLVCLDTRLADAARREGFDVVAPTPS